MEYVPPYNGSGDDPYVDANPAAGIEGSIVPAAAIEHPMREILAVIEAAELTPDGERLDQLLQAIGKLIAAAVMPVATKAEMEAGERGDAAATALGVKQARDFAWASRSLGTHGYQVMPSGLIIQWGADTAPANGTSGALNFPIAFPTAALWMTGGSNRPGSTAVDGNNGGAFIVSEAQYKVFYDDTVAVAIQWIAIGH